MSDSVSESEGEFAAPEEVERDTETYEVSEKRKFGFKSSRTLQFDYDLKLLVLKEGEKIKNIYTADHLESISKVGKNQIELKFRDVSSPTLYVVKDQVEISRSVKKLLALRKSIVRSKDKKKKVLPRTLLVDDFENSFYVLGSDCAVKTQVPLSELSALEIQKPEEESSPANTVCFSLESQAKPYFVEFKETKVMNKFCKRMSILAGISVIDPNRGFEADCLRFNVTNSNGKHNIYLNSNRMVRKVKVGSKPKEFCVDEIESYEKDVIDRTKLHFVQHGMKKSFTFESATDREQFVGRLLYLQNAVDPETYEPIEEEKDQKLGYGSKVKLFVGTWNLGDKPCFACSPKEAKERRKKAEKAKLKKLEAKENEEIEDRIEDKIDKLSKLNEEDGELFEEEDPEEDSENEQDGDKEDEEDEEEEELAAEQPKPPNPDCKKCMKKNKMCKKCKKKTKDKHPGPVDIDEYIPKGETEQYDIYVLGIQEARAGDKDWIIKRVLDHVSTEETEFELLVNVSLVVITIMIFVKKSVRPRIHNMKTGQVATGLGGVYGNKGGVAVSFYLDESPLLFICSHLAARAERLKKRAVDYRKIVSSLALNPIPHLDLFSQYQQIFFFGDLNYRIVADQDGLDGFIHTIKQIMKEKWEYLQERDQMLDERINKKTCFVGYEEGELVFPPTYRMVRLQKKYGNKRNQIPSWTDRVLWKSLSPDNNDIELLEYNGCPNTFGSDHRPVYAKFDLWTRCSHHVRPQEELYKPDYSIIEAYDIKLSLPELDEKEEVYLSFEGIFLEKKVDSSVVQRAKRGFDGWKIKGMQIPDVVSFIQDTEYMKTCALIISVYSKSQSVGKSDVLVGSILIPMRTLYEQKKMDLEEADLSGTDGLYIGKISATLSISIAKKMKSAKQKEKEKKIKKKNTPKGGRKKSQGMSLEERLAARSK